MVPISIEDLAICFEKLKFSSAARNQNQVSLAHPRYLIDGHHIGISFKKVQLTKDYYVWELDTKLRIVERYPKKKLKHDKSH